FTAMDVHLPMKVESDGTNVIAGGVIGLYAIGKMENVNVVLSGSVAMSGASSVAGGVVGQSQPDHRMSNITLSSMAPEAFVRGNGTVGGIVGVKAGAGTNTFEL